MQRMDDIEKIIPEQMVKSINERRNIICIVLLVGLFLVVTIILATLLGHCKTDWAEMSSMGGNCASRGCLKSAAWLSENMDDKANPCEDFYRYSCGGWASRSSIPPGQSQTSIIEELEQDIDERLRALIERIPSEQNTNPMSISVEGKLQAFYYSCLHDYGRTVDGGRSLADVIATALSDWFLVHPEGFTGGKWQFDRGLSKVQADLLVNVFFETWIETERGSGQYILSLKHAGLGLRSYLHYTSDERSEIQDAYKDYIRRSATLLLHDSNATRLTPTQTEQRVEQFVNDVYGLEVEMANMMRIARETPGGMTRMDTTLGQLSTNLTQINWQMILSRMFPDLVLTGGTRVRLSVPGFYRQLDDLIRNETGQHVRDRIMNNYMVWRILLKYGKELSWDYREAGLRYREALYGQREWESTWHSCLDTVRSKLGSLLALEFIKYHIGDTNEKVKRMFETLKTAAKLRLRELDWMDNTTYSRAVQKIQAIKGEFGFSDIYYNKSAMNLLHADLNVSESYGYFINLLNVNKFQRRSRVRLFLAAQHPISDHLPLLGYNHQYWAMPYLYRYWNKLQIPAGSLVAPLYDPDRPEVINFGVLGGMVASEMVGSVDSRGRYFWKNSSYEDWWTNETDAGFRRETECFVKYFNDLLTGPFLIDGENVTVTVRGDAQVDQLMDYFGGFHISYKGYKQYLKDDEGKDDTPVGLGLTSDQLFFLSAAQTYCYLRTDQLAYQYAMSNYIPEGLILNSIVSHMPQFTDAFQCPVGSAMRATYQCDVF